MHMDYLQSDFFIDKIFPKLLQHQHLQQQNHYIIRVVDMNKGIRDNQLLNEWNIQRMMLCDIRISGS